MTSGTVSHGEFWTRSSSEWPSDAAVCSLSEVLETGGETSYAKEGPVVRRLTPRECERLQGMPDDWTRIPYRGKFADDCPDGPRYKAIGNSMAVPVMRWIGERIAMVDKLEGTD